MIAWRHAHDLLSFLRAAALCRRLYNRPGLGVGHFETVFGGRQRRRGAAPEIHAKAAGEERATNRTSCACLDIAGRDPNQCQRSGSGVLSGFSRSGKTCPTRGEGMSPFSHTLHPDVSQVASSGTSSRTSSPLASWRSMPTAVAA